MKANCEICKNDVGVPGLPICKYEEIDEINLDYSSKDIDSMYTENCTRFEEE